MSNSSIPLLPDYINDLMAILRNIVFTLLIVAIAPAASAAEDYRLPDLDGNEHSLAAQKGKWLIINFWATWCAPCLKEMPELQAFYERNRDTANVWGVTFEETPVETIREFADRLGVTYPIVGRANDPITPFGQVRVLPTTFIVNPEGKFQQKIEGLVTRAQLEAIIAEASLQTAGVQSVSQ